MHGLTATKYKQMFPQASFISDEVKAKLSLRSRNRQFRRNCKNCGIPYTTGCTNVWHCPRCQEKINRENHRRIQHVMNIRSGNSRYRPKYSVGTFTESYLEVTNGRVMGATLLQKLQKGVSANAPCDAHQTRQYRQLTPTRGTGQRAFRKRGGSAGYLIMAINYRAYCCECGEKVLLARENNHYTFPVELCCSKCGLVSEESPTIAAR